MPPREEKSMKVVEEVDVAGTKKGMPIAMEVEEEEKILAS